MGKITTTLCTLVLGTLALTVPKPAGGVMDSDGNVIKRSFFDPFLYLCGGWRGFMECG